MGIGIGQLVDYGLAVDSEVAQAGVMQSFGEQYGDVVSAEEIVTVRDA